MKKKAFTLVEMMIVLVIIGVMLGGTMFLGTDRISKLQQYTSKSNFQNSYEQIHSQVMSTNYFNNNRFEYLTLRFTQDTEQLLFRYQWENTDKKTIWTITSDEWRFKERIWDWIKIVNLQMNNNWKILDTADILMYPYQLNCQIFDQKWSGDFLTFSLKVIENEKEYCFAIVWETCRIKEYICDKWFILSKERKDEDQK